MLPDAVFDASSGLVESTSMTSSQKANAGNPSKRIPASKAMISDSVEECETAVCFFANQLIGTKVRGPINTK